MRVSSDGDLRSECQGCSNNYRGLRLYHWFDVAVLRAGEMNRIKGRKWVRVVIVEGHFAIVDYTWERND